MASKGKSKSPKIDPAYQAAVEAERDLVQQQLTDGERFELQSLAPETAFVMAPTTLCTAHVPNEEKPLECAKCGVPLTPPITVDMLRRAEEESRMFDKLAATDDGPVHEPASFPGMVEIKTVWLDRAVQMAKADGFTVSEFIERLIKRQWIASGAGKGKR